MPITLSTSCAGYPLRVLLTFGDDFSTSYPHIKEMHFLIQQLLALPDLRFDAWRVETG